MSTNSSLKITLIKNYNSQRKSQDQLMKTTTTIPIIIQK